jgi:hypothetical protein
VTYEKVDSTKKNVAKRKESRTPAMMMKMKEEDESKQK